MMVQQSRDVSPARAGTYHRRSIGAIHPPQPAALWSSATTRMPQQALGIIGPPTTFQPGAQGCRKTPPGTTAKKGSCRHSMILGDRATAGHARLGAMDPITIISGCLRSPPTTCGSVRTLRIGMSSARHAGIFLPRRFWLACTSGERRRRNGLVSEIFCINKPSMPLSCSQRGLANAHQSVQQARPVSLLGFRYFTKKSVVSGRDLPRRQSKPGGEAAALGEYFSGDRSPPPSHST
jgi:hypothetical protein